jgi:hypothetical protein
MQKNKKIHYFYINTCENISKKIEKCDKMLLCEHKIAHSKYVYLDSKGKSGREK